MRRIVTVLSILAVSALAVACGGTDKTSTSAVASSGDAASILSQIKAHQGPLASDVKVGLTLDGAPAAAGAAGALLSGPITLELKGVGDTTAKSADMSFAVGAGALNLAGKLRSDGTHSWIQYGNDWYVLDASQLGGVTSSLGGAGVGSAATADPAGTAAKLGSSLNQVGSFLKDAKVVGTDSIDGVDSTHISGTADIAKLLGSVSGALGSSSSAPTAQDTADMQKAVRTATVDLWVGKGDAELHKLVIKLDLDLTKTTSSQTAGMKGLKLDVTATMKGADAPKITAPENPKPAQDLLQALFGSLGPALGGGLGGTLTG
jgi:hypothetical protein